MTLSGEQVQQYARDVAVSLEDVTSGRPFTPHLEVWKVRDKVFLVVTDDDPDLQIITVKVDPHEGDGLRRGVHTVTSGRYFDKRHWISIAPGVGVTKRWSRIWCRHPTTSLRPPPQAAVGLLF